MTSIINWLVFFFFFFTKFKLKLFSFFDQNVYFF